MEIGTIKASREIERRGSSRWIWHGCIDCGKERWVQLRNGVAKNQRCGHCAMLITSPKTVKYGREHHNWKGGRIVSTQGYIHVQNNEQFFHGK